MFRKYCVQDFRVVSHSYGYCAIAVNGCDVGFDKSDNSSYYGEDNVT